MQIVYLSSESMRRPSMSKRHARMGGRPLLPFLCGSQLLNYGDRRLFWTYNVVCEAIVRKLIRERSRECYEEEVKWRGMNHGENLKDVSTQEQVGCRCRRWTSLANRVHVGSFIYLLTGEISTKKLLELHLYV